MEASRAAAREASDREHRRRERFAQADENVVAISMIDLSLSMNAAKRRRHTRSSSVPDWNFFQSSLAK
jgi:hypothetical protein